MISAAHILATCLDAASPEALARQMLMQDPVAAPLALELQRHLVCVALEDGARIGAMLRSRHHGIAPQAIARALGVAIVDTAEQPWAGPLLRHADYRSRPPEIRLFRTALESLDLVLIQPGVGSVLGIHCAAPVFVAHELYHHVEATSNEPPLARRHAVTRLRIATRRLRAPVLMLSEIAAGACAQAMLTLPYHPAILDLIALSHAAPHVAWTRAAGLAHVQSTGV
jgi:hypothetical protein